MFKYSIGRIVSRYLARTRNRLTPLATATVTAANFNYAGDSMLITENLIIIR